MDLVIYAGRIGLISFILASILFATTLKDRGGAGRMFAFATLALATVSTLGPLLIDFIENQRILHAGILLAGLIGLSAVIAETKFRLKFAGPIASPLATILLIFELLNGQSADIIAPGTPLFLSLHVASAILGELAGAISFIIAMMFIWQQRALKEKNIKDLSNLPALDRLASGLHIAVVIGFVLLSITLVTGAGFAADATKKFGLAKLIWAIFVWVWYLLIIISRNYLGKPTRTQAHWAIFGFLVQFFALYALL
jgi:ABC-type uncharacterized transport system permease subunit